MMSNINSPQMSMLMGMLQGKNPKDMFYDKCKEMGINPDDILNVIK